MFTLTPTLTPDLRFRSTASRPAGQTEVVSLSPGETLAWDGGRRRRIRCLAGVLWVTQESDPDDHLLAAGDAIELAAWGRVVVEALAPSRLLAELL